MYSEVSANISVCELDSPMLNGRALGAGRRRRPHISAKSLGVAIPLIRAVIGLHAGLTPDDYRVTLSP